MNDNTTKPARPNPVKNSELRREGEVKPAPPKQQALDLGVEVEMDVGGIEMGVLENGIPFLTQRGLSEISGTTTLAAGTATLRDII